MTNDTITYAVYGTLRTGESNARVWQGLANSNGFGTVKGYRLVTGGYFPYALPDEDEVSVVEIIEPIEAAHGLVRNRLDQLEGYPTFYDRFIVDVETSAGTVKCWMYVPASNHDELARMQQVTDNDWTKHCDLVNA